MTALLLSCAGAAPGEVVEDRLEGTVGRPGPLASATVTAISSREPAPAATEATEPSMAALQALTVYLDGLASQTLGRSMAVSEGAARRIALVRMILAEHNRAQGRTTTVTLTERRFEAGRVRPDDVSFRGRAVIRSVVSGDASGDEPSLREIADPVMKRRSGRWVVSSFRWSGAPVVAHEASGSVTHEGVELRVEGSVAFGEVVGIVVLLFAEGPRSVSIEDDRLLIGSHAAASGFHALIEGQPGLLYLAYPRRDERPDAWQVAIAVDEEPPAEVTLAF